MKYVISARTNADSVPVRDVVFTGKDAEVVARNFWRGLKLWARLPNDMNKQVISAGFFKSPTENCLLAVDRFSA